MRSVLFVCTGNICRSPTAEAVFRRLVRDARLDERLSADSAGTHDYHAGEPPDARACSHATRRGYDLSMLRARRVEDEDFRRFDLIIAMDRGHLRMLQRKCPEEHRHKLHLFMHFAPRLGVDDVPDPYYGGPEHFEVVLDLVEAAAAGLLNHLRVST